METRVDLSEFNLLIATPMMNGQPDDTYNTSLDNTKQLIRQYGGKVENFKTKFIADVAYARSALFGAFLRNKDYTHCLMIDDDMGWTPEDVVWMLLLKRDFIAAVGPKKCHPPVYAFTMLGDDGKEQVLYHELETNVATIPFVGGAFVMISRECVERMAEAYHDLQLLSTNEQTEFAVYDPIIINDHRGEKRRRLSEDYAFCYRWRQIGGKVEVKMDVTLTHTGNHTFTGNLYSHLTTTKQDFNQGYAFFNGQAS